MTELAGQLGLECVRYMYRLLFLFYIEARPELGLRTGQLGRLPRRVQPRTASGFGVGGARH